MILPKQRCLGQECRRLLEAAEKTVSRSFLCLGFAVSQSVMAVEQFVYFAEQNALSLGSVTVYVRLYMCGFDNTNVPAFLAFL